MRYCNYCGKEVNNDMHKPFCNKDHAKKYYKNITPAKRKYLDETSFPRKIGCRVISLDFNSKRLQPLHVGADDVVKITYIVLESPQTRFEDVRIVNNNGCIRTYIDRGRIKSLNLKEGDLVKIEIKVIYRNAENE